MNIITDISCAGNISHALLKELCRCRELVEIIGSQHASDALAIAATYTGRIHTKGFGLGYLAN